MGKPNWTDSIRQFISTLAWRVFLWSIGSTAKEYWTDIWQQEEDQKEKYNLEQMIDNEINWCKEHKDQKTHEFANGFIRGLEQVKNLIMLVKESNTLVEK